MIDFKTLAELLQKEGLLEKSFMDMNKAEITALCEIVCGCVDDAAGYTPPYIENGRLVIPLMTAPKYRWWQGGQSIIETLDEIGASNEVKSKYFPAGYGSGIKKFKDH